MERTVGTQGRLVEVAELGLRAARDALSRVPSGSTVAVGGSLNVGHPMALVRTLLQVQATDLTVVAGFGGFDVDILVGSGSARRVIAAFVGAEAVEELPPALRWATEANIVEAWDIDEGVLLAALRAESQYLPFSVWSSGLGTAAVNSPLVDVRVDEESGRPYARVSPLAVDVALLWAESADEAGNVLSWGPEFGDVALANAAQLRIVQVERIVPTAVLERAPDRVYPWLGDVIVSSPLGTYPFGSNVLRDDLEWLRGYAASVRALRTSGRDWSAVRELIAELLVLDGDDDAFLSSIGVPRLRHLMS